MTKGEADPALEGALARFEDALNRSGYPFQYAVLRQARAAFEGGRSRFMFEVSEFPVAV